MPNITEQLASLDVNKRIEEVKEQMRSEKNPRKVDALVREYKILHNLQESGLSPVDAFTRQNVHVIPSKYRSPIELPSGGIQVPDINPLYRDIGLAKELYIQHSKSMSPEDRHEANRLLYNSLEQLQGYEDPSHNRMVKKNPFGVISSAQGSTPKSGYFQSKVTRKRQDLTGGAVIIPEPAMDMDEISVPYKIGFKIYDPWVRKELYQRGFTKEEADYEIGHKTELAKSIVQRVGDDRLAVINRAPSIWASSVTAHRPVFKDRSTIGISNAVTGMLAGDFDGDQIGIHAPVLNKSVEEARKMMPSKNLIFEANQKLTYSPEHASAAGLYMLSRTPEGRARINAYLPPEHRIRGNATKKDFSNILLAMAKNPSYNTAKVMQQLDTLGTNNAFESGLTFSLSDIKPMKSIRDRHIKSFYQELNSVPKEKRTQDYLYNLHKKYADLLSDDMYKEFEKNPNNNLGIMIMSKSRGNPSQARDIVASPFQTLGGKLSEMPIETSYAEGMSPADSWQAAKGARSGVIGRAQDTALPGALGMELMASLNQIVTKNDIHDRIKTINLPIKNHDDVLDRILGQDVIVDGKKIFSKNSPVTMESLKIAKKNGIDSLPVYTPLGSSFPDGTIPSVSYGLNRDGRMFDSGENIGVITSHSIVYPLFTSSMDSFHTGSSIQGRTSGYPRIKQLLEQTKELPMEATLAEDDGVVAKIIPDDIGGKNIIINTPAGEVKHYVSPGNTITTKIGDKVNKGMTLSDGPINPKRLASLTSLENAQNYMVEELHKQVPNARRRSIETIVEGITRHGKVIHPGDSDYLPGDIDLVSNINEKTKDMKIKPEVEYVFKGVNTLPQASQDWLSQLNFRNQREVFKKRLGEGAESDLHGYSPIPGLAYGAEFGDGEDGGY